MLAAVMVTAAGVGAAQILFGGDSKRDGAIRSPLALARELPVPQAPAFVPGQPRLLSRSERPTRWATVRRPSIVRHGPSASAPAVAVLETRTPEDTSNLVTVLGDRRLGDRRWLRVRLPVLPNNTLGWIPRNALGGFHFVHTHLIVDVERLSATLLSNGRAVFAAPVAVGTPSSPTPTGEFYIRNKLTRFANPFYGPLAFGTSARSAVLTDWPAGGFVGIHGTNQPGLIPGRVSHGCIRLRNRDILRLARLMPVGTPVTIR